MASSLGDGDGLTFPQGPSGSSASAGRGKCVSGLPRGARVQALRVAPTDTTEVGWGGGLGRMSTSLLVFSECPWFRGVGRLLTSLQSGEGLSSSSLAFTGRGGGGVMFFLPVWLE